MTERLKILYVDDEPDIRIIVEMALGLDEAMDVKLAESGYEGLELLGRDGWIPDIALIDMMMPGMSGMDMLGAMRAREDVRAVPVVFVTASARQDDMNRYVDAGAIGVISKPFDPMSLARTVREYSER
ncbi:MAG: response regulator [Sphingobium phenoxybenzoativorans]|uniref:response regulator n=1 Tax=Sphingobium phenoxybenzoativorans TaxID=1592790 RepID=UPI0008723357|nr:response regulator [Sphingobium phenoxybenzoativorans]